MKCVHRGFPNTEISGTALFAAKIWLGKTSKPSSTENVFAGKDIPLLYRIEAATQKAYSKSHTPKTYNQKAIYQRN